MRLLVIMLDDLHAYPGLRADQEAQISVSAHAFGMEVRHMSTQARA